MADQDDDLLNLQDAAQVLGLSDTALREFYRRHPDAPGVGTGSHGKDYRIPIRALAAFRDRVADEASEAQKAHQAKLRELTLELFPEGTDLGEDVATPEQRKKHFEAVQAEMSLRRAMGELVDRAAVEALLARSMVKLRTELLEGLPAELVKKLGLDANGRVQVTDAVTRRLANLAATLSGEGFYREPEEPAKPRRRKAA